MKNQNVSIAVIDDGINEGYYNTGHLLNNLEITPDLNICIRKEYDPYENSHGTICAAIIKKYAKDALLSSIKILNKERKCKKEQLLKAIKWCVHNKIKIINLSLGTIDRRDYLSIKRIVNFAYKNGLILIASQNNMNIFTYLASLSNVIGVRSDEKGILKQGEFLYNLYALDCVEITCYSEYTLKNYSGKDIKIYPSNSYSTPFITAIVYHIIKNNPEINLKHIKDLLFKMSMNYKAEFHHRYLYPNIDWIDNAIVINLTTDTRTAIIHEFTFEVKEFVKLKYNSLDTGLKEIIKRINRYSFDEVDALVVLVDEGLNCASKEIIKEFMENMDKRKISVVYINDKYNENDLHNVIINNDIRVWHPLTNKLFSINVKAKKIDAPIIMIADYTGNKVINILTGLRKKFIKNGYFALATAATCFGKVYDIEYVPSGSKLKNTLIDLFNLHNPDVILHGEKCISDSISKNLNFDILIVVIEKNFNDTKAIGNKFNTENIIFITDSNTGKLNTKLKIFSSAELNYINSLYEYIITLFKTDKTENYENDK